MKTVIRLGDVQHVTDDVFAWEITAPKIASNEVVIVYAKTTVDAVDIFAAEYPTIEHFEVRWLSDNE